MHDDLDYGGFWRRAGALLFDLAIMLPIVISMTWLCWFVGAHPGVEVVAQLMFSVVYGVFLVFRFGGTPGKLLMSLRVTRLDGTPIALTQAVLRHAPELLFGALMAVGDAIAELRAGVAPALFLTDEESRLVAAMRPSWVIPVTIASAVWIWSELIVLLTNKRRRALHDFLAGTVVIRTRRLSPATVSTSRPPDGGWRESPARVTIDPQH